MPRYHYEKLSAESASHLMLEKSRSYSHSMSILIFESGSLVGKNGRLDVDAIRSGIASRLHLAPRYRERLKWIPNQNLPVFIDDHNFNLDYHVRHAALPHPGDLDKLHALAARLMSARLDRSRPLWECWIVEGLPDDRFALVMKHHSCMIENNSGSDLLAAMLSTSPDEPFLDGPPHSPRPAPSGLELARDEMLNRLRLPLQSLDRFRTYRDEIPSLRADFKRRISALSKLFGYTIVPPRATPINGEIGPHRRVETIALPLNHVRTAHRQFDCTVHDVVLAIVSRALKTFLEQRLVHPASFDLRVSTPVQVPAEEGRDEIQEWLVVLPVWKEDVEAMIESVRSRTREAYADNPALGAKSLFSAARWSGSRTLTLAARNLGSHTGANLSVVNVPGSSQTLYFRDGQLAEAYGFSPIRGEQALSITTTSYNGQLFVGLNADYDLLPDIANLRSAIESALDELAQVGRRRSRKRTTLVPAAGDAREMV